MPSKRRDEWDLAPEKKGAAGEPITQNKYPRVLRGRALQQLEVPRKFLASQPSRSPSGTPAIALPSDLAVVRAALKARKLKLG